MAAGEAAYWSLEGELALDLAADPAGIGPSIFFSAGCSFGGRRVSGLGDLVGGSAGRSVEL